MQQTEQTVFVVDDDEAMRDALRMLLRSSGLQVEVFASAAAFLNRYMREDAGCLVLDIRMPGMSGLALQDELQRRRIGLPIVFLTGHADVAMAVGALKKGAFDFMEKPFEPQRLLEAVQGALALDAAQANPGVPGDEAADSHAARLATLSGRERQVLDFVLLAKPTRLIAAELGISVKTVEFHRAHIREKLGVATLPELFRLFAGRL